MALVRHFWDDIHHVVSWRALGRRRPFYLVSEKVWDGTVGEPPCLS